MYRKAQFYFTIYFCLVNAQVQLPGEMLSKLKEEFSFESILLLQNEMEECWMDLSVAYSTPIINLNGNQYFRPKNNFKTNFLALICLHNQSDPILRALYRNLDGMRETPTLFLVNESIDIDDLFSDCHSKEMLNVLAIGNWSQEHIYSYQAFPQYNRIKRRIAEVQRFLEPQLMNMAYHPFVTLSDNVMPRSVIYRDADGSRQLAGYLLPFMHNFVKRLNATLLVWWEEDLGDKEILSTWKIKKLMNMGKVDIPMSISEFPSPSSSYVMEMSKCQLMLPIESEVNRSLVMINAANPMHFILVSIAMLLFALLLYNAQRLELGLSPGLMCLGICIDSVLRAMICQPFVLRRTPRPRLRWIYMLLFVCSFLSYNVYVAQLQMLLVHPLREPPVRTYEDMRRTGLKILLTKNDRNAMTELVGKEIMDKNWDVHRLVDTATFQAMRSQPNTSYAYPITQTLWPLIERMFARRPRVYFRLSEEFTYISMMPYSIPLIRNSFYRLPLNRFILDTHSSGLYNLWRYRVFYKLVANRQFTELPYEGGKFNTLLQSNYSSLYAYAYFCAIAVSLLVFVLEIVVHAWLDWRTTN